MRHAFTSACTLLIVGLALPLVGCKDDDGDATDGAADTTASDTPATGTTLALVDALQRPALHHDQNAWTDALQQLESLWFTPVLSDLKARRLTRVRIRVPDDRHLLELDVTTSSLWKFWRKPLALDTLLRQTPNPASDVASSTAP